MSSDNNTCVSDTRGVLRDNRCTLRYRRNDHPGRRREMHRVTIDGDRPL